jgi:hypothetical protein
MVHEFLTVGKGIFQLSVVALLLSLSSSSSSLSSRSEMLACTECCHFESERSESAVL